jgi:hypothetical protein
LYGANAAGKTNLLEAFATMNDLVVRSATMMQRGDLLRAEPFKLDPRAAQQPSEFEVVLLTDQQRYIYGFRFGRERVHEEWLSAARLTGERSQPRMLFERRSDGAIAFGDSWRGERARLTDRVRDNALFLSVAVQFNNETVMPVFDWFRTKLWWYFPAYPEPAALYQTARRVAEDAAFAERLGRLARMADLGVASLELRGLPVAPSGTAEEQAYLDQISLDDVRETLSEGYERAPSGRLSLLLHRRTADGGDASFDLPREESAGTRRLFALADAWPPILDEERTLLVDELESSLHPLLGRHLLAMLHSAPGRAQLVFTTHDANLLDSGLFRRDQVWFCEKNADGATELYSLWDFRPRKGENLRKGYLGGRYGAVPFLGEWTFGQEEGPPDAE